MHLRMVLALAVVATAIPAAPAEATQVLKGQTSQSRAVALWIADDGRVERVALRWRARCARPGFGVVERTVFRRPFDTAAPDRLGDAGVYRLRQRGGYRLRVRIRIDGAREDGAGRWAGTFDVRVLVRRHGRPFDRCRARNVRWSAALPAPLTPTPQPIGPWSDPPPLPTGPWSFDMTGDAGDYITQGRTWSHGPEHGDKLTVRRALPEEVEFHMVAPDDGDWRLVFAAPPGQFLTAGTTYTDARRYPFHDEHAGISISGMGRACGGVTGDFSVHEIAFDEQRRLRRFRVTFEQRCGDAAARGTFDYAAAS